ncbi:hypothetical protein [Dactylosporangium sp. NPDC005555]|uniref:hypothetical protein n=1 Tax=Dactylosporangium sp. NPDC005555 TaxID=3154889 RepID=UPI0033BD18BF
MQPKPDIQPTDTTVDDQTYLQQLFDDGVVPQNAGGDAAIPDRSFFDETVYVG